MKTIIQSRKTRGLYIQAPLCRSSGELFFLFFLMCFSLPESNSFPGPRQLHINWPRRRCQGYSTQVLWRCHRQLNIDLEVHSYSLCLPVSLFLLHVIFPFFFPFISAYLPSLCMGDCLFVALSLSQTHTHTHSLSPFIDSTYFSRHCPHPPDVFPLSLALSHHVFIYLFLSLLVILSLPTPPALSEAYKGGALSHS